MPVAATGSRARNPMTAARNCIGTVMASTPSEAAARPGRWVGARSSGCPPQPVTMIWAAVSLTFALAQRIWRRVWGWQSWTVVSSSVSFIA
jgi:hypothetical protein